MANYPEMVSAIVDQLQVSDLLHYGNNEDESIEFIKALKPSKDLRCQVYDKDVVTLSDDPIPSEMVVCLDVDDEDTLDHLQSLTERVLFCAVDSDDGISFWLPLFWERFDVQTYQYTGNGTFYVIASAISDNSELQ